MLQGLSSALTGTDISLSLLIATNEDERARTIRHLDPSRVDGVVHLTPHTDDPIIHALNRSLPTVLCDAIESTCENMWTVHADDFGGGQQGARHLVEQGCRTIAVVGGPRRALGADRRLAGHRDVLGEHLREDLVVRTSYGGDGGSGAIAVLLAREPGIDGVLCASDRQARGVLVVLQALGRSVPEDVRVVGFDDQAFAARSMPTLTTIRQPIVRIGATAAELLQRALQHQPVELVILPTELAVRASA